MHPTDAILLRSFAESRDNAAFEALVERHLSLVYSVALRVLRRSDIAQDVSQQTFIRLACKAGSISHEQALVPWLHLTARSLAVDWLRSEGRRRKREKKVVADILETPGPNVDWRSLAPLIDGLLGRLSPSDQALILLRYYENRSFSSVAASLGLTEDGARKRAIRALEKLRRILVSRGVPTSSAVIAAVLPTHAAITPPSGLLTTISAAALPHVSTSAKAIWSPLCLMTATTKLIVGGFALLALGLSYGLRVVSSPAKQSGEGPSISNGSAEFPPDAGRGRRKQQSPRQVAREQGKGSGLSELATIRGIENASQRQRELSIFFAGLPPGNYQTVADELVAVGVGGNSEEMMLLIAAWSAVDGKAALDFASSLDSIALLSMGLSKWQQRDFEGAYAWADKFARSSVAREYLLDSMLTELSQQNPERAFTMMRQNADCFSSTMQVRESILRTHPGMIWDLMERIPNEGERRKVMVDVVHDIAEGPWQTMMSGLRGQAVISRNESWDPSESGIPLDDQLKAATWLSKNVSSIDPSSINAEGLFRSLARAGANDARVLAESFPEGTQLRESALKGLTGK